VVGGRETGHPSAHNDHIINFGQSHSLRPTSKGHVDCSILIWSIMNHY
jgi:hypothetical protein